MVNNLFILVEGGVASMLCGKASRNRQLAVAQNGELDVIVSIGGDTWSYGGDAL